LKDWGMLNSMGAAGDMLIGWRSSQWKKVVEMKGSLTLSLVLQSQLDDFEWAITNVYWPNYANDIQILWTEMRSFRQSFQVFRWWQGILM